MNQWLTKTDLLEQYSIGHDVLINMVLDVKLTAYRRGEPLIPIDVPRKTETQKVVERIAFAERRLHTEQTLCKEELYGKHDCFLNEDEKCPDAIAYYSCHGCWTEDGFLDKNSYNEIGITDNTISVVSLCNSLRISKLISILEDVETNWMIQCTVLEALLPLLRFRRADVEAWETNQGLAPQTIEPQRQLSQSTNEIDSQKERKNFFNLEGEYWNVGYENEKGTIRNLQGIHDIVTLLDRPGKPVSCKEIYQAASGKMPDDIMTEGAAIDEGLNIGRSKQAISDYKAKQNYGKQWQQLQNDLDNAESDMERKEIKKEMDDILPFLKERTFADPDIKKVQSNLKKRLDTAYKAIDKAGMKKMAKHLRTHIKPDGAYGLCYSGSITWEITIK